MSSSQDLDSQSSRGPLNVGLFVVGLVFIVSALSDNYLIGGGPGFGSVELILLLIGLIALGAIFLARGFASFLLTALITGLLTLALSEVALRALFAPRLGAAYQLHAEYLYELKPNFVREYSHQPINGGHTHRYAVNRYGYRGEEFELGDGKQRLYVFGDSFIHAAYTPTEGTFTEQLETDLGIGGAPIDVVNAGVAGWGPDQVLKRLKVELPTLDAKLVVVGIFSGNDFGDLVRNKLFRLDAEEKLVPNEFVLDEVVQHAEMLSQKELYVRRLIRRYSESDAVGGGDSTTRVKSALVSQQHEYEEFVVHGNNVVTELRSDPYSADISLAPNSPSAAYKIKMMSAVMAEIAAVAARSGVPLVFVTIPHPTDVMRGQHEAGYVDDAEFPDYSPDRLMEVLRKICIDRELKCVDLMATMRKGGADYYLKGGDDHWNAAGQGAAAQAVATYLLREGMLP